EGLPAPDAARGRDDVPVRAAGAPLRPALGRDDAGPRPRRPQRAHPAAGRAGDVRRRGRGLRRGQPDAVPRGAVHRDQRALGGAGRGGHRLPARGRRRPVEPRRDHQARRPGAGRRPDGLAGRAAAHPAHRRAHRGLQRAVPRAHRAGRGGGDQRRELHRRARRARRGRDRHRGSGVLRLQLPAQPRRLARRLLQPRLADRRRAGRRVPGLPAAQRQPGAHLHGRLRLDAHRPDAGGVHGGRDRPGGPAGRLEGGPGAGLPAGPPAAGGAAAAAGRPRARRGAPPRGRAVAVHRRPPAPAPPAARPGAQPPPRRVGAVAVDGGGRLRGGVTGVRRPARGPRGVGGRAGHRRAGGGRAAPPPPAGRCR
ncbi:MAG: Decaprenyl-phosphate N-acetylglucosaminephosphotransferase, partial [uncultured Quadrisphaera sp.]